MPEKTCSTCQCNKVCDHNKYGFENCGNYISADLAPRAEAEKWFRECEELQGRMIELEREVAREIFEEIDILGTYNPTLYDELKKKYMEDSTDGKRTDH